MGSPGTANFWLRNRGLAADDIVVAGASLGTGVAVQLAAREPVGALVLGAPYSAIEDVAAIEEGTCSILLTPTAKYLGAMTILSFILSLVFGGLGLIVGKNILEVARTEDEAGSEETAGEAVPEDER